jgi:hypothetical protein
LLDPTRRGSGTHPPSPPRERRDNRGVSAREAGTAIAPVLVALSNAGHPTQRLEVLVRTLRGEKYLRRALLQEIVDRFASDAGLAIPLQAVRALLVALEGRVAESDYEGAIAQLESLIAACSLDAA